MNTTKRSFKIAKIERETHNVKIFTLNPVKPEVLDFTSGMFVSLTIVKDGTIIGPRSYSVASSPLMKDALELAIQKVGVFTTALFELEEGAELMVQGPFGRFVLQQPVAPHVCLMAGGTGIAPMMCMLRYIQDSGSKSRVTFLYSVRTQGDIIYKDELTHRSQKFDNFCYIQTLTREPEDSNWQGHRGRISAEKIKQLVRNYKEADFYMCGPEPFVKALEEALLELEIAPEKIKKEQWG